MRMKFALSMAAEKVFLPIKPNRFLRLKVPEEDRRSSACRKGMRTLLAPPPLSRRSITTFTPGSASTSASISENAVDIGKDVAFSQTLYLKKTVFNADKYSYPYVRLRARRHSGTGAAGSVSHSAPAVVVSGARLAATGLASAVVNSNEAGPADGMMRTANNNSEMVR